MYTPSDRSITAAAEAFEHHSGVMRTHEALDSGIQPRTLYWMLNAGMLERFTRGVYYLASHPLPAQPDVVAVMQRVPGAVLCLISALNFHGIGTQIPREVQIALPRDTKAPRIAQPRVRAFTMDTASFAAGVEEHLMGRTPIRVFGIAKTVADCFKFRNKIGQDVAIEALQEVIRSRSATPAQVLEFAEIDRVARIVRPYLEALL